MTVKEPGISSGYEADSDQFPRIQVTQTKKTSLSITLTVVTYDVP